ncbi:hypothetical protein ACNPPY_21170 [Achromobacter sp. AGC78]
MKSLLKSLLKALLKPLLKSPLKPSLKSLQHAPYKRFPDPSGPEGFSFS